MEPPPQFRAANAAEVADGMGSAPRQHSRCGQNGTGIGSGQSAADRGARAHRHGGCVGGRLVHQSPPLLLIPTCDCSSALCATNHKDRISPMTPPPRCATPAEVKFELRSVRASTPHIVVPCSERIFFERNRRVLNVLLLLLRFTAERDSQPPRPA